MPQEVHDLLRNIMLDFMKLFYDGKIEQLHEISDLDPDPNRYQLIQSVFEWHEYYKAEDFEVLKDLGFSIQLLSELKEKFEKLYNFLILPIYQWKISSFNLISIFYYRYNLQAIHKSCEEVKKSMKSYDFKEQYLINHDNYKVQNFYQSIPKVLSEIDKLIDIINEQSAKISLKDEFIFTSHFSILQTFLKDIENKDFTTEEYDELTYNWAALFIKGFALSQISVKLGPEELAVKNKKFNDIEYEQYCNLCWRIQFTKYIMNKVEIHEEKLNDILKHHSQSKSKSVLIPFIQTLIPYYKTLISPEGLIRITMDKTKEYEKIMNKVNNSPKSINKIKDETLISKIFDDFLMFDKFVYGLYLDRIPFSLYNSPGDSYLKLLKNCLNRFNHSCFLTANQFIEPKAPCDELFSLEEASNLDDLMNQKYFIVDSVVKNIIHCSKINKKLFTYLNTNTSALFLSILPWKIDCVSDEARELESRMIANSKFMFKNSPLQSILYDKMQKFIIKNVWNANKPLDKELLKSKVNPYIDDSCNIS